MIEIKFKLQNRVVKYSIYSNKKCKINKINIRKE